MKKLRFAYYFLCIAAILMLPAFAAYVDGSVLTFGISAVAAIAIAAGAVINSRLRKAKQKAMEVLNIDENERKEKEDDLVVFAEEEKPAEEDKAE